MFCFADGRNEDTTRESSNEVQERAKSSQWISLPRQLQFMCLYNACIIVCIIVCKRTNSFFTVLTTRTLEMLFEVFSREQAGHVAYHIYQFGNVYTHIYSVYINRMNVDHATTM